MTDSISIADFGDKKRAPGATPDSRPRWWLADNNGKADERNIGRESEVAQDIASRVQFLKERQSYRIRNCIAYARLYGNSTLMGVTGLSPSQMSEYGASRERVTDSIVQSVVDTVVAQVGENKPRPYFLTSGGSYKQQRKAKRLNWFTDGIFYENKAYELGGDCQRDGEVFGDGLVHIADRNGRVTWERTLSAEWWIDEVEGGDGKPREAHWEHNVDREVLAARFPKKRAEVMLADRASLVEYGSSGSQADLVCVRESWHLRSSPDSKDGRHVVTLTSKGMGCVLLWEDWEHDFFPIARFKSMSRPWGFWGQGVAERLQGKQIEMNVLLAAEQRSMKLAGTFKVFVEDGSKIVKEHLNNQIGAVVTYRGTKPQYEVTPSIPPEYAAKKQEIKEYCYESEGVSRMSAAGIKPAGLDSGEAQRTYRDTVALRMKTRERNNEAGYMEAAAISIAVAADIAKRSKEGRYVVQSPHGLSLREVSMTAEELEKDDWTHKCFPTSSLPKDPGGRLQTIQEYVQAGFMSPRQARRALDFPDLEAVESLANAAEDLITQVLDSVCDDGESKFRPPEPTMDLTLAKEIVVEYINRGEAQELEDDKLELLRTWSQQVDYLVQASMPPPPPMGAQMAPQAAAAPPPVSNLVPNVPG